MPKKEAADSLFAAAEAGAGEPLAARMRPRDLDEFIGQERIVGPGRLLRRAIQKDQLGSIILSGPPGTGKTTLARVIANGTKSRFVSLNAVLAGIQDLRDAVDEARRHKELYGRRTILFVDEVHRWNKAQQDALLPWVENGTVVLVGATTENPFFAVNRALVSRSRVFLLEALTREDLARAAEAALRDTERGYGKWRVEFEAGALEHLVDRADGDARSLLNALELAVETSAEPWPPPEGSAVFVTLAAAEESIQRRAVLYDRDGDAHYDASSALIKSLRGSDPDAALFWLARMVYAGEDPGFIFRRLLISAGEDVGLADPWAIAVVQACAEAFDRIGMPEGQYQLAEAVLYLATAPKSNSALAYFDALAAVEAEAAEVPDHLKDANRDAKGFGHGEGYLYPHAYRDHWTAQQYLPDSLRGRIFYQPGSLGVEGERRRLVLERREAQLAAIADPAARLPEDGLALPEGQPRGANVWSAEGERLAAWKTRAEGEAPRRAALSRAALFDKAAPRREDRILVLDRGDGYLVWEALRRAPEGQILVLTPDARSRELIEHYAASLPELERPIVAEGSLDEAGLGAAIATAGHTAFDLIAGRDILSGLADPAAFLALLARLFPGSRLALAESLPREGGRLRGLLSRGAPRELSTAPASAETAAAKGAGRRALDETLRDRLERFEEAFYRRDDLPALGPGAETLKAAAGSVPGLLAERMELDYARRIDAAEIRNWLSQASAYGAAARREFSESELGRIAEELELACRGRETAWPLPLLLVTGRLPESP